MKAIVLHADGGPDVLRYEEVADPVAGPGEVVVELRAASLNRLDIWLRRGMPSVAKPRILGADGAGVIAATGERVVIDPTLDHDAGIVLGEHRDGTHAERIALPRSALHPIPDGMTFEQAAAFPLVFETAYRMLVTKAALRPEEWVLIWGIGSGVATAALAIAKALGARVIVTSGSAQKLARAQERGADVVLNHDSDDVPARVRALTGAGVDVVCDHVGETTWSRSLASARKGGRIVVCGATSGSNPPASLHRIWWRELTVFGSSMGSPEDFRGAYELVVSGRAAPVIDSVFPLSQAARAHELLERGDQFGKVVLTIPG